MKNLFKWRTVVIIAHRLQTVKHADDIILIENGEIKERGTHKWLVKLKGQYSKMLELQSW
jgi:ABC-type multidrug transport system fused ATPase/permease subunit